MKPAWTTGNRFTLLENGEAYYPRVFDAIRGARREVLLETFILFDDAVGRELREALLAAAANGAQVHVLVDGWGSAELDTPFLQPLLDAGVHWHVFEPAVRWLGLRLNPLRRMHRKVVVVDGEVAFVGGINYSLDHLAVSGPEAKQDYAVEVAGPLVQQIQAFCRDNLAGDKPPRLPWWRRLARPRAGRPPPADAAGRGALVARDNLLHRHDIERQYRLALRHARRHVLVANAYFFPGWRLLREMRRAARRGVLVELVLQGQPDMPIVRHAASLLHGQLLRSGVRVLEYGRRPLHGKVAVVDDEWATVGSSNLDPTSLGLNLEANVLIHDREFARTLHARLRDLIERDCRPVQVPVPGPLGLAWSQLRTTVVYHLLRWWPRWTRALPPQQPVVRRVSAPRRASA
ncbi:MAG: cardiolipin synthase ClsB [Rubrivivax sp.]|nr:cardiolipin synthase ClsB [Rubrivivax sp.]